MHWERANGHTQTGNERFQHPGMPDRHNFTLSDERAGRSNLERHLPHHGEQIGAAVGQTDVQCAPEGGVCVWGRDRLAAFCTQLRSKEEERDWGSVDGGNGLIKVERSQRQYIMKEWWQKMEEKREEGEESGGMNKKVMFHLRRPISPCLSGNRTNILVPLIWLHGVLTSSSSCNSLSISLKLNRTFCSILIVELLCRVFHFVFGL